MRLFLTLPVLLLACLGSAQITSVNGSYRFRMRHRPGQVIRHETVMTQSLSAQEPGVVIRLPIVQTVRSIQGDKANVRMKSGPMTLDGREITRVLEADAQIDTRGRVVGSASGPAQTTVLLPDRPLKPGQTWSATAPTPNLNGIRTTANFTYRFIGVRKLANRQVAEIDVRLVGEGTLKLSGTGKIYLDMADGILRTSTMRLDARTPESPTPLRLDIKVNRVGK